MDSNKVRTFEEGKIAVHDIFLLKVRLCEKNKFKHVLLRIALGSTDLMSHEIIDQFIMSLRDVAKKKNKFKHIPIRMAIESIGLVNPRDINQFTMALMALISIREVAKKAISAKEVIAAKEPIVVEYTNYESARCHIISIMDNYWPIDGRKTVKKDGRTLKERVSELRDNIDILHDALFGREVSEEICGLNINGYRIGDPLANGNNALIYRISFCRRNMSQDLKKLLDSSNSASTTCTDTSLEQLSPTSNTSLSSNDLEQLSPPSNTSLSSNDLEQLSPTSNTSLSQMI